MYAFHPIQLYIRGSRRTGDEGYGSSFALYGVFEFNERFGDEADDLVLAHHAQVVVGEQGYGPASLPFPTIEDDRAGLGDT